MIEKDEGSFLPMARYARQVGFLAAALLAGTAVSGRPLKRRRPPRRPGPMRPTVGRPAARQPVSGEETRAFEQLGRFLETVTKGIVTVLLTIFGRATPVDVEYWQLEKL